MASPTDTPAPVSDSPLAHPAKFLSLVVQLVLLYAVIRQFDLENPAFHDVTLILFAGFVVHAFLPLRFRQSFFLMLSLGGIAWVFGWISFAWLLGLGLPFIAICHLPLKFHLRAVLLLVLGAGLAVIRKGFFDSPVPNAIWPILGSMFMFRLAVYLYDLEHEKTKPTFSRTLSYFYLLPNICFPLFPVIDYKTFTRNYYKGDVYASYQRGVTWIGRGILHLLIYRWVYREYSIGMDAVHSVPTLLHYMIATYLLYLRVSGTFHIIIGSLNLFGYGLPETHHLFYLASSFNDYWRRINIYWKDFMMKLFYYPSFFRLKKLGPMTAMIIATMVVFFMTWFLHAYQWFWLIGKFPVRLQDIIFWGILGLVVVGNAAMEARRGRKRSLTKKAMTWPGGLSLCLRTFVTFSFICVLWSLWNAASVPDWVHMMKVALTSAGEELPGWFSSAGFWMGVVGFVVAFAAIAWIVASKGKSLDAGVSGMPFGYSAALTVVVMGAVYLVGLEPVYSQLPGKSAEFVSELKEAKLNRRDTDEQERGYYEDLQNVGAFNSQLWEVYLRRPQDWTTLKAKRFTNDFMGWDLFESVTTNFKGHEFTTNSYGMRDIEYELEKPPGTYRVAVLGSSYVMGSGVGDGECFEALLEERLNQEMSPQSPHQRIELLNFSAGGYTPPQLLSVLTEKALRFKPDAVWFVGHANDNKKALECCAFKLRQRQGIPFDYILNILKEAQVDAFTPRAEAERRLRPFTKQILDETYQEFVALCKQGGAEAVWIFLPRIREFASQKFVDNQIWLAQKVGFSTVSLNGIYDDVIEEEIRVAEWDLHPNQAGHELIADWLFDKLREDPTTCAQLGLEPATSGH